LAEVKYSLLCFSDQAASFADISTHGACNRYTEHL